MSIVLGAVLSALMLYLTIRQAIRDGRDLDPKPRKQGEAIDDFRQPGVSPVTSR